MKNQICILLFLLAASLAKLQAMGEYERPHENRGTEEHRRRDEPHDLASCSNQSEVERSNQTEEDRRNQSTAMVEEEQSNKDVTPVINFFNRSQRSSSFSLAKLALVALHANFIVSADAGFLWPNFSMNATKVVDKLTCFKARVQESINSGYCKAHSLPPSCNAEQLYSLEPLKSRTPSSIHALSMFLQWQPEISCSEAKKRNCFYWHETRAINKKIKDIPWPFSLRGGSMSRERVSQDMDNYNKKADLLERTSQLNAIMSVENPKAHSCLHLKWNEEAFDAGSQGHLNRLAALDREQSLKEIQFPVDPDKIEKLTQELMELTPNEIEENPSYHELLTYKKNLEMQQVVLKKRLKTTQEYKDFLKDRMLTHWTEERVQSFDELFTRRYNHILQFYTPNEELLQKIQVVEERAGHYANQGTLLHLSTPYLLHNGTTQTGDGISDVMAVTVQPSGDVK